MHEQRELVKAEGGQEVEGRGRGAGVLLKVVANDVHGRRRGREGEAEAPVTGCCCYSCEEAQGELVGLGMNPEGMWERRQRLDPFGIERGVDLRGRGRGCWLDRGRRSQQP